MRQTGKEIAEFCDVFLKKSGRTIAEMCRATGLKKETVSMWKSHPDTIPRIDSLIAISEFTQLTVSELIGQQIPSYSGEILEIAKMAESLTQTEIASIVAVTKTFYDAHKAAKREIG